MSSFFSRSMSTLCITAHAALISSCGTPDGDEQGKDPRIPVSMKQPELAPNSQPNQTPSSSGGTNLNDSGNGVPPSSQTPSLSNGGSQPDTPAQPPATPPSASAKVTVKINGLHNDRGNVCLSMFNSPEGYPDSASSAVLADCFAVIGRSFEIKIENVAPGTYAIALWHDENRDKKLNYNFLGIPKEGLAFSQNGKPKISPPPGPPSFSSIAFEVKAGESVTTDTQMSYLLDLL